MSCPDENTLLTSRFQSWNYRWNTVDTDPGGQLRDEGRQIVSEITPFIQKCADAIDADSITLFSMAPAIIIDQIDRNVRLGPAGHLPVLLSAKALEFYISTRKGSSILSHFHEFFNKFPSKYSIN